MKVLSKLLHVLGINVAVTNDIASPQNGDIWYNLATNKFRKKENNVVSDLSVSDSSLDVIGIVVDAGSSIITSGSKGLRYMPSNCTIVGWDIRANKIGNIKFDILINNNSIVNGNNPMLITEQNKTELNVSNWQTLVQSNDVIEFIVVDNPTINKVTLSLIIQK